MNAPSNTIVSGCANGPQNELSDKERRQRWFEIFLVVLVAFGGYLVSALYLLLHGPTAESQVSSFRAAGNIVQEVAALLLLGYVLSRRGLKFSSLGLRWSLSDVRMGLLTHLSLLRNIWGGLHVGSSRPPFGLRELVRWSTARDFFAHPSVMAIPLALLNPFFEELIVRAYLMTEVMELTGSSTLAVVLSVFVQFAYHLYYGWSGAISLAFFFLALALYYVRSRRALPVHHRTWALRCLHLDSTLVVPEKQPPSVGPEIPVGTIIPLCCQAVFSVDGFEKFSHHFTGSKKGLMARRINSATDALVRSDRSFKASS